MIILTSHHLCQGGPVQLSRPTVPTHLCSAVMPLWGVWAVTSTGSRNCRSHCVPSCGMCLVQQLSSRAPCRIAHRMGLNLPCVPIRLIVSSRAGANRESQLPGHCAAKLTSQSGTFSELPEGPRTTLNESMFSDILRYTKKNKVWALSPCVDPHSGSKVHPQTLYPSSHSANFGEMR